MAARGRTDARVAARGRIKPAVAVSQDLVGFSLSSWSPNHLGRHPNHD
jgi:hypothetical protein